MEKVQTVSSLLQTHLRQILEANYELGNVHEIYEIFGGYINRSFGINCKIKDNNAQSNRFFLRKYKKGISEKEILFEHSLIEYSIANGFTCSAAVVNRKHGGTIVKVVAACDEEIDYYALYHYLDGEDKYPWDNPVLNSEECASAGEVLALFHRSTQDFNPQGLERTEAKIMDLLSTRSAVFKKFAASACSISISSKFHHYFLKKLEGILDVIERTILPADVWQQMPQIPCHNDYHPGNLKFKDNQVVGVFDFDWSKIDLRLFDLCLAIVYCCCSWDDRQDGELLLDKCEIFLKTYQDTLSRADRSLLLTPEEKRNFSTLMAAANLYLINWDVCAYYNGTNLNEYEYLSYLQHNVRLMEWIELNKRQLDQLIMAHLPGTSGICGICDTCGTGQSL
ncbi:MAG: phosphotransferase [Oligoflexia bacterium]|nr:phosphotransferase [Oligoflexia bacterium]